VYGTVSMNDGAVLFPAGAPKCLARAVTTPAELQAHADIEPAPLRGNDQVRMPNDERRATIRRAWMEKKSCQGKRRDKPAWNRE